MAPPGLRPGDAWRWQSAAYFDSFTVVFGWDLPYFGETYRPDTADRYFPPEDEPLEPLPFDFATRLLLSGIAWLLDEAKGRPPISD